jgi:hypothetical protein
MSLGHENEYADLISLGELGMLFDVCCTTSDLPVAWWDHHYQECPTTYTRR